MHQKSSLPFPWNLQWTPDYPSVAFAPERLWQPLNPGWTFGNVLVTTQNSSAPEVEQAIAQEHSYGRQIGHMQEALVALLDLLERDASPTLRKALAGKGPLRDFRDAAAAVAATKDRASQAAMARMLRELAYLKKNDPQAWEQLLGPA